MSLKVAPIRWNDAGDPKLVITAEGVHDVYRLAEHLTHGQCEFADLGFRVIGRLKRRVGRDRWSRLMRYFWGDGGFR